VNYTQLADAISAYTQNYEADFVASIPTFIRQAEQRIYNSVQLPVQRAAVTAPATASNQFVSTPPGFLSVFSFAVISPTGGYEYMLNKDVNFVREAFPFPGVTGKPRYYALFDEDTFILGPTPDQNYSLQLHYNHYPVSITSAGTSWLGDNFDSVLLYGSLIEAYIFMKGEADMMAAYQVKFEDAVAKLKRLGDGLDRQDAYRSGQLRIPVS
jgi:hypothetical protein